MYEAYFGLSELPFSITPDPQFLYMSERHREALAHLLYGIREGGGFVQLTGEVGTGKTTLCRCVLQQLPENADVALIINPRINEKELLQAVCNELGIPCAADFSLKALQDAINQHLLEQHAAGRRVVLIVDEAQNLTEEVLEQLRLLTNLETSKHKLLQIILIGQPELLAKLQQSSMRQLAQRITARYHLLELSLADTGEYIRHRLSVVGCKDSIFTKQAIRKIYQNSRGIPRLVNIICDRALLGAYAKEQRTVDQNIVRQSCKEIFGARNFGLFKNKQLLLAGVFIVVLVVGAVLLARLFSVNKQLTTTPELAPDPEIAGTPGKSGLDEQKPLSAQLIEKTGSPAMKSKGETENDIPMIQQSITRIDALPDTSRQDFDNNYSP